DFMNASKDSAGIAVVINNRGQVILAPEDGEEFKAEEADLATDLRNSSNRELAHFIEDSLHKTTDLRTITIRDKQYYAAGAPMPTVGWAVISLVEKEITELPERQMLAEYDEINVQASAKFKEGTAKTRQTIIWIMAGVFVLSSAAALLAASHIVKPIKEMTDNIVKSSRTGELFEMKDSYRTNDEIEVLAESFDDLSKKTRQYIEDITEITREKERVSTELSMASQIQNSMLPHVFPPYPNRQEFDIYATMKPAKEVGGDFYDFFLIDEDHLGLVIADVSGKGVPAALFMMIAKTILQSCAMLGKSASEILAKTNEALCSNNQVDMFVTVWIGILELSTGKLTASNAGHEYPVLKHPDGRFELFRDKHGFVLGGIEGAKYKEYELRMEPGAKLFVYTDGVPEATDAENRMFGLDRMMEALNREPDAVPGRILENVHEAVDIFVRDAEQFDDLTMLCLEYKGSETEAKHENRV
ncbi:MAG: SpoIIE family protein phosphatase, partial [Oscillospiraceae bacterium]|nr:SpoIIE family protein phosphatase [Oscillospiraceae bacterium]